MTSKTSIKTAKRNKISPQQLFFLLYISRVVVCLTDAQSVTFSKITSDILVSIVLSLGLTLLLYLPVIYCRKKGKSPFDIKWLGALYSLFFIFTAGLNVSRFSYFASTTLNPETQSWVFAFFIVLCACYCAMLGIEALSRFSFFAFSLMILAVAVILASNVKSYEEINLYPVINSSKNTIFLNTLTITSNTIEGAVFLCLADRLNAPSIKSFASSISASFFTVFVLFLFMIGIMGDSAAVQSFPLYSMFQMSKISSFERLDILHISFWVMAVFVKTTLLIYCASISVKKFKMKNKCIFFALCTFAVCLLLINTGISQNVKPVFIIVPFLIFCVIIPLLTLIFKKKNKGDDLVKKF